MFERGVTHFCDLMDLDHQSRSAGPLEFKCIPKHRVKETKTFLKEHPENLAVNADNGNVTVLINKAWKKCNRYFQ